MPGLLTETPTEAPTKKAPPKIEEWPVKEPEVPQRGGGGGCPDYEDDAYRQWGR